VGSVINIVYYMHKEGLKKPEFFGGPQSNGICGIHSKSGQKGEFDHHTLNISIHSPCKFIPEFGYCNIHVCYDE
jgi:hypothetical protein